MIGLAVGSIPAGAEADVVDGVAFEFVVQTLRHRYYHHRSHRKLIVECLEPPHLHPLFVFWVCSNRSMRIEVSHKG